jgi:hypothetical protein
VHLQLGENLRGATLELRQPKKSRLLRGKSVLSKIPQIRFEDNRYIPAFPEPPLYQCDYSALAKEKDS